MLGLPEVAGAGVVFLLLRHRRSRRKRKRVTPTPPSDWQGLVALYAAPLEEELGWRGFTKFAQAVAYTESRGNPNAGTEKGNAAIGLYGLRPKTARVADKGLKAGALKDPAIATAMLAWLLYRLLPFFDAQQPRTWLAMRRGTRRHGLINQSGGKESSAVHSRFRKALRRLGIPQSFEDEEALGGGTPESITKRWPGSDKLLELVREVRDGQKAA